MNLYDYYSNKRVLITGNTGFKGSWLTAWLLKMNAHVYGISDKIPTTPSMYEELNLNQKIKHHFHDIRNYADVEKAILSIKPDYVFHLAAQPIVSESYTDPLGTLSTNIIGTAHILEAMRKLENQCIGVFISSDKCYENVEQIWGYREIDPLGGKDIYSCSKGAAEIVFHSYFNSFFKDKKPNLRIASARAGNVIGGGDFAQDRIVPDCMRAWSKKEKVIIRSPWSTRPWQHVLEPLSGYLRLGAILKDNQDLNGESFNFGPKTEQNETVGNLINELSKYWGFQNPQEAFDYTEKPGFKEAGYLKLNCDKAHLLLNWHAILQYADAVRYTSEWYREFFKNDKDMLLFSNEQIAFYEELQNIH